MRAFGREGVVEGCGGYSGLLLYTSQHGSHRNNGIDARDVAYLPV